MTITFAPLCGDQMKIINARQSKFITINFQERIRCLAEIEELQSIIDQNADKLERLRQKNKEQQKWDRYMLCDGRPDPTSKKEINTFINLMKEDTESMDIGKVLKQSELVLEVSYYLISNTIDKLDIFLECLSFSKTYLIY